MSRNKAQQQFCKVTRKWQLHEHMIQQRIMQASTAHARELWTGCAVGRHTTTTIIHNGPREAHSLRNWYGKQCEHITNIRLNLEQNYTNNMQYLPSFSASNSFKMSTRKGSFSRDVQLQTISFRWLCWDVISFWASTGSKNAKISGRISLLWRVKKALSGSPSWDNSVTIWLFRNNGSETIHKQNIWLVGYF